MNPSIKASDRPVRVESFAVYASFYAQADDRLDERRTYSAAKASIISVGSPSG
jgi:hypothetical protein